MIGKRWKARSDEVKQVYEQPKVYPHIAGQVGTARPDKRQRGSNPEYSRKAGAGGERLERLEFKASGAASAQTEQPSVPALPRKNRILIVGKTAPAGKKWDARNKKFKVRDTPRPGACRAGSSVNAGPASVAASQRGGVAFIGVIEAPGSSTASATYPD